MKYHQSPSLPPKHLPTPPPKPLPILHPQRRCLFIQRVVRIRIGQQLRQQGTHNRHEVVHRCPFLIQHIQTNRTRLKVHIGVIHWVDETDAWGFERVFYRQLNTHFPLIAFVGGVRRAVQHTEEGSVFGGACGNLGIVQGLDVGEAATVGRAGGFVGWHLVGS